MTAAGSRCLPGVDPSVADPQETAAACGVDPAVGLTTAEAQRRLLLGGPNEVRQAPPEPWWHAVLRQFQDPLVYLLLAAVLVALAAWLAEGRPGPPVDAVVIALIVVANAAIGYVQEARAADAVAALARLTAAASTVLRDARLVTVPSAGLVVGDILRLAEGDAVGADARLLTTAGLRVQEAALTGESAAVAKSAAALDRVLPVADRTNMVYKGTAVAQGVGAAVVVATGMATQMGSIARLLEQAQAEPSPLEREVAAVSRALGVAVVAIALVVMGATAMVNPVRSVGDLVVILLLGVSLAVAAVPEGLPAVLSLVLAIGVRAMARRHAVVKHLHSVETLGCASVICSDKTGTLTRGEMTLGMVLTPQGAVRLSGVGYRPEGAAYAVPATEAGSQPLLGEQGAPEGDLLEAARLVLVGGAVANDAQLDQGPEGWQIRGDPTEGAFLVAAPKLAATAERIGRYRRVAEVPFTSERKLMSVLAQDTGRGGARLFTKGAPDVLLTRCTAVRAGGQVRPLGEEDRRLVLADVDRLSDRGFRTIGVAYRDLGPGAGEDGRIDATVESELVYLGVVGIIDPPRDGAARAVAQARRAGIRVVMITGDHPRTALSVARDVGIARDGGSVLTGAELDALSRAELEEAVGTVDVFARVEPAHKLRIVDALQARGQVVAMTGDGVNDAPALKAAAIGVAMGLNGTEVTKEASSMVLGDDDFATIVAAVRQGRTIFRNITTFLRYLLSSNMGEVATVFFGVVLAEALGLTRASGDGVLVVPLLATQILWINLVTDSGPALALGVDPETDDVMSRPPRRTDARILDRAMWAVVLAVGLLMGTVTLLTVDVLLPGGLVEGSSSLATARTAGFTTLVLAQLFNVLASRSATSSAFRHLFVNPWLWASIVGAAALQVLVVHLPVLQAAFGTAPLSLGQWALCVAMGSVVLWAVELGKLVRRATNRYT